MGQKGSKCEDLYVNSRICKSVTKQFFNEKLCIWWFSHKENTNKQFKKIYFGVPGQRGKTQAVVPVGLAREGNLFIIGSAGLA